MNTTTKLPAERPVEEANKPALTIVPNEEPTTKKKRTRKPNAPKPRTVEELATASCKSMSDKEKDILINDMREKLTVAENKIYELKLNCDAAYKRARSVEEDFKSMETYYKERLAYITMNTKMFYQSVCLATKGDVK